MQRKEPRSKEPPATKIKQHKAKREEQQRKAICKCKERKEQSKAKEGKAKSIRKTGKKDVKTQRKQHRDRRPIGELGTA